MAAGYTPGVDAIGEQTVTRSSPAMRDHAAMSDPGRRLQLDSPETVQLGGGYEVEIPPPSSPETMFGVVYLKQETARVEVGRTVCRSSTAQGRLLIIAQARRLAAADGAGQPAD